GAALVVRDREDRVGGGPFVEAGRSVRRNAPQRRGEVDVSEELTTARCAAVGQVGRRRARLGRQLVGQRRPVRGDDVGDREALFRIGDRGREELGKRQRSQ